MWDRISARYPRLWQLIRHGLFPALFYLLWFCLLTYPLMGKFFTAIFGDEKDGLQNVWNVWWVNLAVRHPGTYPSIWYTNLLHWPWGTTLVGHTLNPFNGYLGVALQTFFSLRTTYNLIVVFTFVAGGLSMYWLAYYLTRSYWASLVAGFVFTFSSYHFAHGDMHLQTASLEWIPLFLLCWLALLKRPGALIAIAAALVLWLVILCDYYYFTYCVLAAILVLAWQAARERSLRSLLGREHVIALAVFGLATLLLAGPLAARLLIENMRDPFVGAHEPVTYSLDLLELFIPGGNWLFGAWTQPYWSRLPGKVAENSVFLSWPVLGFMAWLWAKRRSLDAATRDHLYLWSGLFALFFLLALGPALHIAGNTVWSSWMPYELLGRLLPFLSLSGVPVRMGVMLILSAAVLSAFVLRDLFAAWPRRGFWTACLLAIIVFQSLPARFNTTRAPTPGWVTALSKLPGDGGVVDLTKLPKGLPLYYQTIHHKPMAFGYLARLPASVDAADQELSGAIAASDYSRLASAYHIRYIVAEDPLPAPADQPGVSLTVAYHAQGVWIYRLSCLCEADP